LQWSSSWRRSGPILARRVEKGDDFFNGPDVPSDACLHRGSHAQRLMHAPEVVIHDVECHAATTTHLSRSGIVCVRPRLVAEEAVLAQDVATEQNRWTDFNQRLEDLERALARR
jgi:hypothetical protein